METIDIIGIIGRNHKEIKEFSFCRLHPQVLLQQRVEFSDVEKHQFDRAMELRNKTRMPFWDSIMLTSFDNPSYSKKFLEAAKMHNPNIEMLNISNDNMLDERLKQLRGENYGWNSLITLQNGETAHIPLFDLHVPSSENNIRLVIETMHCLGLYNGYILNSGESYHYIHNDVYSTTKYHEMMKTALFYCPIIDRLWLAHQMKNGSSTLRIGKKNGIYPLLVQRA